MMMHNSTDIEQYILNHIDEEDEVLKELTRQTHMKVLRARMLSGHLQGQLLTMLVKMLSPKRILEIGTFTGYSAICMAKGLPEGGIIDTIEINDELQPLIDTYINKSGNRDKIKLHIGCALEIIPSLEGNFDMIFMDGDKREYPAYYTMLIDRLNPGGLMLADNVLWDGKVIEPLEPNDRQTKGILDFNDMVHQDDRVEKVILPIRDGITMIRKKS